MFTYQNDSFPNLTRKTKLILLAFFSFCGVLSGVSVAYSADPNFSLMMRRAINGSVSIVSLVSVTLLSLLITAVAIILSKPYLFLPLSFIKCFLYAFVRSCVNISFFGAGWLIGPMFLFSDTVAMILLFWIWIRCILYPYKSAIKGLSIGAAFSVAICFIDCFWVSPFLITLMND